MFDFLTHLFDTSGFPPRWYCGSWSDAHGWLHILSDLAICSAYFAIPVVLVSLVLRRRDIPFRGIFWLFGAFILACGTTHLMEAIIFWHPLYRLAGVIKLFTALVSWATVLALVPIVPKALAMRSPEELEREISARKEAEAALHRANADLERQLEVLRASEERFRLLVEGTRDYAIFMLDPTGRIASWNPGAQRIKQYRADEIVGQHFSRFYPKEAVERGWPAEELRRATAEGRFEDEGWRVRKDGSQFWANVVITALKDAAGTLRGFSKITRDMTERKQAEENAWRLLEEEAARRAAEAHAAAIAEERERLRVTLHSIGDGVIATDAEGRVTLLNPVAEALTGWRSAEAAGQPLPVVFPIINEITRREVENPVARVLREGAVVALANHTLLLSRDSAERPIDDSAAPIKDTRGNLLGVILVFRDGTERRRAEQEITALNRDLQRRVSEFQTLLEVIPIGIAVAHGPECRRISGNPALARLLRLPTGANVSLDALADERPDYQVFHNGRELAPEELPLQFALRTRKEVQAVKNDIVLPDGTRLTLLNYAVPLYDEEGRVRGGLYAGVDVTEQERTHYALRESEQRWRTMAEALPNLVWTDRPDGQCDWLSSQWGKYTGIPENELLGLRWLERVIHPDDRERTLACWQAACADQGDYDLEYRIRRYDGEYHWFKTRGVPIRDEQGKIVYWFGTCTDIEDRKRSEQVLAESEERFRQLAENISEVFWMTDPHTTQLLYISPAYERIWGRSCQSLYDNPRSFMDAIHPEDRERVRSAVLENQSRGEQTDKEYRVVRPDGSIRWVRDRAFPVKNAAGQFYRLVGIIDDFTERKQAEEALKEADKRKDEFLATLAHELRNPLAPLRNALQILKISGGKQQVVDQAREMMERQMRHMVRLVDDLLDLSRITRGKIQLRKERVGLAVAVQSAVETSRPLIEAGHHELTVTLPPEPVDVDADVTRLAQVFANLLNNSAKYTPRGGRINLTVEREGSDAVVTVEDNGMGIPSRMLPHIFEMFTQVDRTLERAQGGLGIGLTLVKRLVEMHDGSVEAHSDGEGRGSRFVVRLPAISVRSTPALEAAGKDGTAAPVACQRRILIVDDNEDSANSLAMMLRLMGNEAQVAHDGLAGVEAAATFTPDIVLLDIGMPKLNGYEAARRIRQLPGGQDMLLVALTGWGQEEDRRRSGEAGFDGHMVKPLDPAALEELLARVGPRLVPKMERHGAR